MRARVRLSQMGVRVCLWLGVLALMVGSGFAAPPNQSTNLGPEDQDKQITVTVWLNLHNKAALDSLVQQMYDKNSPNYHHWLTMEQYKTQFAPTAKEAAVVRDFLASRNMKVSMIDQNNHFVVAQGRVGDAQQAFNVQMNRVMVNGAVHRVTTSAASVTGPAAPLVAAVQGLNDLEYATNVSLAANPATGQPYPGVSTSSAGADGLFFSGQCLFPPQLVNFNTAGTFPSASYFGNRYGAAITSPEPNLPPCGYDSAELQTAYGLNPLYSKGLTGAGQTIVIVDAFGSNTIVQDANIFSELNGLPPLTPSNFQIVDSAGPGTAACTATNGCEAGDWQFETSLDVEWAHAIAPGANIVLVLGPNNSLASLDNANLFAIENGFGNVLSNSFGTTEIRLVDHDPAELAVENGISELAASLGISQHVSSGDSGDNLALDNAEFGINSVSVNANADSPFVTGIGGTSTFLDSKSNIELQTGWGNNATAIAFGATAPPPPLVPPVPLGFLEGAGGGTSVVYAKPAFQDRLPGQFRLVPDISMNADPQTGVELIVTPDGILKDGTFVFVAGGTSLSAPMFSGVWAIANQENAAVGGGSLGQAAPLLYELSNGAITDVNVNPLDTLFDVSGFIFNPPTAPVTFESAPALAQPLENTKFFLSALFQPASNEWVVLTFGTDSSLFTTPGWDDVTGLGTPNGERFINEVVEVAQHH